MNNTPLINLIQQFPGGRFNVRTVQEFIERSPNSVNERDTQGNTPLHWVIIKQYHTLIRLLLDNGADINARNTAGNTPLHLAVLPPGNVDSVETLIVEDADTNIRNNENSTPLEVAEYISLTPEDISDDYEDIIDLLEEELLRNPPEEEEEKEYPEFTESEYPEFAESPFWMKYSSTDKTKCSICYKKLSNGQQVCLNANCQHGFHCSCIRPWLERNNTCPSCRATFLLRPLGEIQQRVLQNSFGKRKLKKRNKLGINQLNSLKKYLNKL
jgi:hypothetical protein